jgi:hypothetical protein
MTHEADGVKRYWLETGGACGMNASRAHICRSRFPRTGCADICRELPTITTIGG